MLNPRLRFFIRIENAKMKINVVIVFKALTRYPWRFQSGPKPFVCFLPLHLYIYRLQRLDLIINYFDIYLSKATRYYQFLIVDLIYYTFFFFDLILIGSNWYWLKIFNFLHDLADKKLQYISRIFCATKEKLLRIDY